MSATPHRPAEPPPLPGMWDDERAQPLRMELAVDGESGGKQWSCGLELDYNNDDSLYCRPLRLPGFRQSKVHGAKFSAIAEAATAVRVAYLPPMAGVAVSEPKWERGRVNVLLGEGQTAQVIRNLCLHLYTQKPDRGHWQRLCQRMQALFGVRLHSPEFIAERGEIVMKYREPDGTRLDLSAAGKGMLQTLLLLCHLYMNPGAVLLLDEPDAHLAPLRQRQIVRTLLAIAAEQDSQVIAASNSEIVISEIAGRGSVVRLDGAAGRAQVMAGRPAGMPGTARAAGWTEHLQAAIKGLRDRGIREIAGDLVIDRSRFAPVTHDAAVFDGLPLRPYNVGPDALLFNFKTVGFRLSPQADGSVRIVTDGPAPDGLSIDNRLRTVTGTCPNDWRSRMQPVFDDRGNAVTATFGGVYAVDCGDRDWYVSLFDHGSLFAGMFARLWRDAGGVWQGQAKAGPVPRAARVLYTHTSAPLATMVTDINKFSNNVMARQLLLTIDAELSKRPGQAKRAAKSIRDWATARGFELPELVIENGSGLSRTERISTRSLAGLLEYGLTAPFASDFLSSLPLAATDGTLAKRFVNQAAEGNAWLKTGTLTGVKALAGYLLLPDGRKMLYVAIVNHGNAEASQRALDTGVDWVYQTQAAKAAVPSTAR